MTQGLSTPIPLRSGHSAGKSPAGAAAHRPRRPARRAGAMTPQCSDASGEPTTGCSVDLAPVGLVGDAMVGVPAAFGGPLGLAGGTERGAA
jgi:hypothetical protein